MKRILLFLFLNFSIVTYSQYTLIPDSNFETYLIINGYDSGDIDGKVLTSNITNVTAINVANYRSIYSLKGIEDFTSLTTLNCGDNFITSLDLSKNLALTELDCSNNQLTSLDISKNTSLSLLICENNQISNLDISKNKELISIVCNENKITSLDLEYNTKLISLYCSNNRLEELNVSKNINLSELWCVNNQIVSLDISKNINLKQLLCYNNKLTSLNTNTNLQLKILYCHNNLITSLDVSLNNNLEIFRCANNQLTHLDIRNTKSLGWWDATNYWTNNPNLNCIYVIDAIFFNISYSGRKDDTASYFDNLPPKFESPTQTICSKQNPTIGDIIVTGYNIKWFDSLVNGNELPSSTPLIEGATYFAMNTAGSCEGPRSSVTLSLKTLAVPVISPLQIVCNVQNSTLENLNVTGDNIKWYLNTIDTNAIPNTTNLINGSTYFASQTKNGCESPKTRVLVNILNSSKPIATNPQTFCFLENATLESIAITGQNIKWYDDLTSGSLLLNTTLLQNNTIYYTSQTINGCESERVPVTIQIQDTPAPTGNANQVFCTVQNPTLTNITVAGENIKWYDAIINGNLLSDNTNLQNGLTYYASQTLNSCESNRLAITVSVQNTPIIPTVDTNPKFCKSENATLDNINVTRQKLNWYESNTATVPLLNNTPVQNNTTYYVSQTIGCESDRLAVVVNVFDTVLPTAVSPQVFCIDENATINSIAVTGQNIVWYDSATVGTILTSVTQLENATYYVTQNNNNCESERLPVIIKIQDTQAPITDLNQSFCIQQNATINTIKINGQNIKWYDTLTGGANLTESTPLENRITYYASQTVNDCESERTPITIQIHGATTPECINFVDELPYPKFFTPNSDGYNDTWTIDFIYLKPNSTIRIFDRYGKFIKELTQDNSWDGMYLNQLLPSSDYWFLATRLNGAEFRSHFSLKR